MLTRSPAGKWHEIPEGWSYSLSRISLFIRLLSREILPPRLSLVGFLDFGGLGLVGPPGYSRDLLYGAFRFTPATDPGSRDSLRLELIECPEISFIFPTRYFSLSCDGVLEDHISLVPSLSLGPLNNH